MVWRCTIEKYLNLMFVKYCGLQMEFYSHADAQYMES